MGRASTAKKLAVVKAEPLKKLDFGCGPNKRAGFEGVDARQFVGVDHVVDLTITPWPWKDNSVEEAHTSHFVEHLTAMQRVAFCNELYRILIPGGTCQVIVPHWCSNRAYGDPTHQWPPVSEFWFYYLSKEWRTQNAPHTDQQWNPDGFNCDFEATWAYSLRQDLLLRSEEHRQDAMLNHKDVLLDTLATLKAKK